MDADVQHPTLGPDGARAEAAWEDYSRCDRCGEPCEDVDEYGECDVCRRLEGDDAPDEAAFFDEEAAVQRAERMYERSLGL